MARITPDKWQAVINAAENGMLEYGQARESGELVVYLDGIPHRLGEVEIRDLRKAGINIDDAPKELKLMKRYNQ